MAIRITEEHEELRQAVRRFVDARIPPAVCEGRREATGRPDFWAAIAEPGGSGCTLPKRTAEPRFGLVEQAVVVEELGRVRAGPYVPTVLAARSCRPRADLRPSKLLPKLATGELTGARAERQPSGARSRRRRCVIVCGRRRVECLGASRPA
jgi:alkylation response protein AidB-like acyl-CoA dehydrogenase